MWFEDGRVVVVDCKSCHVPMVVLKRHGVCAGCADVAYMVGVAGRVFPGCGIRYEMRSIRDHCHLHVIR